MDNTQKAIDAFHKMRPVERKYVLLALLNDGTINIAEAIASYGSHLEEFKQNAKHDIYVLSEAGLDLAQKTIKEIPKMKVKNKQQLAAAQTQTLLNANGGDNTEFNRKLEKCIEGIEYSEEWYDHAWALKTLPTTTERSTDE